MSASAISQNERGLHEGLPKAINLAKLARAFGISVDELLRGPDSQTFGQSGSETKSQAAGLVTIRTANNIPGPGFITIPAYWIGGAHGAVADLFVTQIQESSMEPSIRRGDLLIAKPTHKVAPGVHIIQVGDNPDMLVTRRLTPRPDGTIRVSCDNQTADDVAYLPLEDIHVVAKIVFIVRGINPP